MNGVPFTPNGTYLLVQVPNEHYESQGDLILNEATKKGLRKEYAEKGDKMLVASIGEGCQFSKVGDKVAINCRGAMEIKLDEIDEPFFLVRESEVLGRFED